MCPGAAAAIVIAMSDEISPEEAGRVTVMAVASDLEHWARSAVVGEYVSVRELFRVLDTLRSTSLPTPTRDAS
ncbi:MAG: hypothetical protein QOE99_2633 [Actinomycetota bacterium]|jgi:hypothetical protein|nr:hypothetical protein [Actinomycetota bacterium]